MSIVSVMCNGCNAHVAFTINKQSFKEYVLLSIKEKSHRYHKEQTCGLFIRSCKIVRLVVSRNVMLFKGKKIIKVKSSPS